MPIIVNMDKMRLTLNKEYKETLLENYFVKNFKCVSRYHAFQAQQLLDLRYVEK